MDPDVAPSEDCKSKLDLTPAPTFESRVELRVRLALKSEGDFITATWDGSIRYEQPSNSSSIVIGKRILTIIRCRYFSKIGERRRHPRRVAAAVKAFKVQRR